jgi:putative membrane protein
MKPKSKFNSTFIPTIIFVGNMCVTTMVCAQLGADSMESDNPYFRKKTSPTPAPGAGKTTAAKISEKDKSFLMKAASSAAWEVKTGASVESKLQNSSVKNVAARLISDHTRMNNELVQLGKKKGLAISVESKGQQIPGPNYDKNYLTLLQQDHQETIALFQKEAQSGDDPEIKAWAKKMLPTLQQHAAAVKQAASKS